MCSPAVVYTGRPFSSAQLWDDQQRLLASTHQLVYYRE
jgi:hypothetical protein